MRYNLPPNRFTLYLKFNFGETWMQGMLGTSVEGKDEMSHVRKMDFDSKIRSLDYSSIGGTLDRTAFPEFKGDFYKDKVGDYYLKPIANTTKEGSYYTVSDKGLILKLSPTIPPKAWGEFGYEFVNRNTLPTTITELNLTDVIHLDKEDKTTGKLDYLGKLDIAKRPTILSDVASLYGGSLGFSIGDFVLAPYGSDLTSQKFVRANGASLPRKDYLDAFKILGTEYSHDYGKSTWCGTPWRSQPTDLVNFKPLSIEESALFPETQTHGGYTAFVTHNKMFVYGGSPTYGDNIASDELKMYEVNLKSSPITFKAPVITKMMEGRKFARAIAANGYVYIIGGWSTDIQKKGSSRVMRGKLDKNGNVSNWEYVGSALLNLFCSSDVFIVKRRIYVRGGWVFIPGQEGKRNNRVFYCHIDHKGDISDWVEDRSGFDSTRDNASFPWFSSNTPRYMNTLKGNDRNNNPIHLESTPIGRYGSMEAGKVRPNFLKHEVDSSTTFVANGHFLNFANLSQEFAPEGKHSMVTFGVMGRDGRPIPNDTQQPTLSTHRITFCEGVALGDWVVIPGGYKAALPKGEKATPQVWKRANVKGFGMDSYMSIIGTRTDADLTQPLEFNLPDLEPEVFDGVVYEYFVKVL